ncbi:MAG: hypothetical protein HY645_01415 [Acidobacteria bacterium]|nr:hypothetical protein [Acidobacteriota bacterium]
MVSITSLWAPILLSAVIVFVVSSLIHMVLPYHRSDYSKVPAEDELMAAMRKLNIPPGDYLIPCVTNPGEMKNPEYVEKRDKGPVALMTVMEPGPPTMGKSLLQWFLYCVAVGILAAYVAGRALAPGSDYLAVFRFAGSTAFIGYAVALWQNSIWYKRAWSITLKSTFDGLIYGLLTAGTFGWLWP